MLAAALCLYLATTGGSFATDVMTYEVTKNIVERGSVAMSYNVHDMDAHLGVDGQYYAPYGVGHAIWGVPFYAAGRLAEVTLGFSIGRPDAVRKAAFVTGSAVAAALVVWVVFLFAWRVEPDTRAAAATAFTAGFGTLLWPYAKFGFNAPVAALAVVGGVYGVWVGVAGRRAAPLWIGSSLLAFALLVRHELALAAVLAGVWALVAHGREVGPTLRTWVALAVPGAAASGVTLAYNYVRFGNIWDTGYLRDTTATFGSIVEGFAGLLISPGRSVFLYTIVLGPALVALWHLFRRDRGTAMLVALVSGGLTVFYASLEYWDADRSYGSRYLLPVLVLVCVPLAPWFTRLTGAARTTFLAIVLVSIAGQLPGVLVDFTKVGTVLADVGRIEIVERRWDWSRAGINLNTRASLAAVPLNVRYVTGFATPPAPRPSTGRDPGFSEQYGYSLDFWWLYLFYMRAVPGWLALLSGAALVTTGGWLLGRTLGSPRSRLSVGR